MKNQSTRKAGSQKTTIESKVVTSPEIKSTTINHVIVIVKGKVTKSDGTAVKNILVKILNKMLRSEVLLGESKTDSTGSYVVSFITTGSIDIMVRAFDKYRKDIASAGPFYRIKQKKTVDLVVKKEPYQGPTEHEQLFAKATEKSEGIKLSSLSTDEIILLSGKTGISSKKLIILSNAEFLSDKYGISKDFFYGLFKPGLKADISSLAIQPDKIIFNTIKRSVDKNEIPQSEAADSTITENINKVRTAAAKETLLLPLVFRKK